jgi:hypothetical protein
VSGASSDADATEAFARFLALAEAELPGRPYAATAWLQVAAQFAWFANPGGFASPRLERLLGVATREMTVPDGPVTRRDPHAGRILHVATRLYAIGGHTRLLQNWLRMDAARLHRVVVTAQGPRPLPDLTDGAGDRVPVIALTGHGLQNRARQLRALAADVDVVLLHVHPGDVLPYVALPAHLPRPRVALLNHADHVFWGGASQVDAVLNLRAAGRDLTRDARDVPGERSLVLPIPLQPGVPVPREQARRELGIVDDAFVVTSMAQPHKYAAPEVTFFPALRTFVRQNPDSRVVLIGPEGGRWAVEEQRSDGRISSLGTVPDAGRLLSGADAYLDSTPFASLTSALEAALVGLPVLTWRPEPAAPIYSCDDPALTGTATAVGSADECAAVLSGWATDTGARQSAGQHAQRAVLDVHTGDPWTAAVDAAMTRVVELGPREVADASDDLVVSVDPRALTTLRLVHQPPAFPQDLVYPMFQSRNALEVGPVRRLSLYVAEALRRGHLVSRRPTRSQRMLVRAMT